MQTARNIGSDLAQYNSVRIAADVDSARQALGDGRIALCGASYRAQLGQHFGRDFPDSLEAVVLEGANSLSRKSWVEERARNVDVGVRILAALCDADARCAEACDIPWLIDQANRENVPCYFAKGILAQRIDNAHRFEAINR